MIQSFREWLGESNNCLLNEKTTHGNGYVLVWNNKIPDVVSVDIDAYEKSLNLHGKQKIHAVQAFFRNEFGTSLIADKNEMIEGLKEYIDFFKKTDAPSEIIKDFENLIKKVKSGKVQEREYISGHKPNSLM